MVETLLVAPPYSPFTPAESAVPPLGLARIASIARTQGPVRVIDMGAYESSGSDGWTALTRSCEGLCPDLIGIGPVVTANRSKARRVAALLRARFPQAVIVMGGPDVTFTYEELLSVDLNVDAVFMGESELSFADFIAAVRTGNDWTKVQGIAVRDRGSVRSSPARFMSPTQLDELPTPAWDLFPLDLYRAIAQTVGATPYLPLETSRGCALGCIFCACSALFERRFRNRTAQSVIREMRDIAERFGFTRFALNDDNPSINVAHLLDVARALSEAEPGTFELTFSATVDCSIFRRPEQLELVARGGFREVFMGCETTSADAIVATRKTKRGEHWESLIEAAITATRSSGLASRTSWILGLPLETRESFLHTIDFIERTAPDTALLSLLQPYPGTEMAALAGDVGNPYGLRFLNRDPSAMIASKFEPVVETRDLKRDDIVDLAFRFVSRLSPSLQANVSGSPYFLYEMWRTGASGVTTA